MQSNESQTPLTQRTVARRGLLAALGGVAAAVAYRFSSPGKTEAGVDGDLVLNAANTGTATTTLQSLQTIGTSYTVFKVENFRAADAIHAEGGPTTVSGAVGNRGVFATGGNSNGTHGTGGDAIEGTGGNGTAGGGTGVVGRGGRGSGPGVRGFGGGSDGSQGFGVIGTTNSGRAGVYGSNAGTGPGVRGEAFDGMGVHGESHRTIGVRGLGLENTTGVKGVSSAGSNSATAGDGDGSGIGVYGKSGSGPGVQGESTTGIGVIGSGGNIGLLGVGTAGAGIWGQSTSYIGVVGSSIGVATAVFGFSTGTGFGVHGESQSSAGVMAVAKTANAPGLFAQNTTVGAGKLAAFFDGNIFIQGSYTATGAKLAIVQHPDGSMRSLYCTEATEPYFEDFGRAQLVSGMARVRIDPDFAPLVHRTSYHVFLTPEGPSNNLYISQQDVNGFEVREMGGKSSMPFSYRIVAKRVDIVGERLKRVSPDVMNAVKAQASAAANAPRPTGPLNPSTLNRPPGGPTAPVNPNIQTVPPGNSQPGQITPFIAPGQPPTP